MGSASTLLICQVERNDLRVTDAQRDSQRNSQRDGQYVFPYRFVRGEKFGESAETPAFIECPDAQKSSLVQHPNGVDISPGAFINSR